MTERLFLDDAYLSTAEGIVIRIDDDGAIILDRTNFYATSGGQPGDTGFFERADGSTIAIIETRKSQDGGAILHVPAADASRPETGERLTLHIDWDRRYRLMRMHTACHLLSVVCPCPITGAGVGEAESRVDFDMADSPDKAAITARLMALIEANHRVFTRAISAAELAANPGLVKSKNVRPPAGNGEIRLVCIGDDASIDSQPCGGTHVSETGEVGQIHIAKIENKGRENRRMRIRFGPPPV